MGRSQGFPWPTFAGAQEGYFQPLINEADKEEYSKAYGHYPNPYLTQIYLYQHLGHYAIHYFRPQNWVIETPNPVVKYMLRNNGRVEPVPIYEYPTRQDRTADLLSALYSGEYKRVAIRPLQQTYSNSPTVACRRDLDDDSHKMDYGLQTCFACFEYLSQSILSAREPYNFYIYVEPSAEPQRGYFFHIDCFDVLYNSHKLLPNFLILDRGIPSRYKLPTFIVPDSPTTMLARTNPVLNPNTWGLLIRIWCATKGHINIPLVLKYLQDHQKFDHDMDEMVLKHAQNRHNRHRHFLETQATRRDDGVCDCLTMPKHPQPNFDAWIVNETPPPEFFRLSRLLRCHEECTRLPMSVSTKTLRMPLGFAVALTGSGRIAREISSQDYAMPPEFFVALGKIPKVPHEAALLAGYVDEVEVVKQRPVSAGLETREKGFGVVGRTRKRSASV